MKAHPERFQFIILGNAGLHTLKTVNITTKSVSSVTLQDINNIVKKRIINYIPQEDIRKSQNLSLFNDKKSICLLHVNMDVLLKNRYVKS